MGVSSGLCLIPFLGHKAILAKIITKGKFMGDGCIFCSLVRGDVPKTAVLETEETLAFLDVSPVAAGHTVLVPKKHFPTFLDLPAGLGEQLIADKQAICTGLLRGLGALGVNMCMNLNEAAGQMVFHVHFHLIPRFAGDGLALWKQDKYDSQQRMAEVAKNIRNGMQ